MSAKLELLDVLRSSPECSVMPTMLNVAEPVGAVVVVAAVAAVSIKLPSFWPADPDVWFLQVEAQFTTRGGLDLIMTSALSVPNSY